MTVKNIREPKLPVWHPPVKPPIELPPRPPINAKFDTYKMDVDAFVRQDKDKNGYVSSDEFGTGKAAQDRFARYDKNDDGKVTLDEYLAGKKTDRTSTKKLPWPVPISCFPLPDRDKFIAKPV